MMTTLHFVDWFRRCSSTVCKALLLALAIATSGLAEETNALGMKLVPIQPGTLKRGIEDDEIRAHAEKFTYVLSKGGYYFQNQGEYGSGIHTAKIARPFHVGATEVTRGQFRKFVEETRHITDAEKAGQPNAAGAPMLGFTPPRAIGAVKTLEELDIVSSTKYTWKNPGFEQTDDHPVVGVSWHDAIAFCQWLSKKEGKTYRLPTEAEWEYVCRAGTWGQAYWFGPDPHQAYRFANIGTAELEKAYPKMVIEKWIINPEKEPSDGFVYTAPVASYPANPWGLHDTHGNAFEWCQDAYSFTAYKDLAQAAGKDRVVADPLVLKPTTEGVDVRIIRGGSFYSYPHNFMACTRSFFLAADSACYIGFRVVRED